MKHVLCQPRALGGVEGQWVRYWDESSTVAVLEFKVEEPAVSATTCTAHQGKEGKEETEKYGTHTIYWDR
jgi:RNA-binding protein 5/10